MIELTSKGTRLRGTNEIARPKRRKRSPASSSRGPVGNPRTLSSSLKGTTGKGEGRTFGKFALAGAKKKGENRGVLSTEAESAA